MSDWRNNPRQGKSLFIPLIAEVSQRLLLGETIKQIYDQLSESNTIEMSYVQFTRYTKRYCLNSNTKKKTTKENVAEKSHDDVIDEQNHNSSDFEKYLKVCFKNERIANRAMIKKIPIETITSWKAPNATRLSNLITSYTEQ